MTRFLVSGLGYMALALVMLASVPPTPASAITAEEMLADPALEARARNLSKQLRCLVCQNQSIDDSDAELAQDLRREVRSQLVAGADDRAILEGLRGKYGDYVLLRPPVTTGTYVLWFSPIAILLIGGGVIFVAWRNRRNRPAAGDPGITVTPDQTDAVPNALAADTTIPAPLAAPDRIMTVAVAALILAGSLGLYLMLGRADLGDQPLASRQTELAAAAARAEADQNSAASDLEAARARVVANPDSVSEWLALAMAATAANDSPTEIAALQQALKITDGDSAVKSMLAEAVSRAADGQVTIPARKLIAEALAANANEPRALFLAGLAAYQDEDYGKAVAIWQRLRAISAVDAPWFELLGQNIADAAAKGGIAIAERDENGPAGNSDDSDNSGNSGTAAKTGGPTAADMAAAAEMDAADQQAMIESMVAGLAERLADNPEDTDGWLRLGRAYDVLGRPADATDAYVNAANAAPAAIDTQITALEYIASNGTSDGRAAAIDMMLARMTKLDPERLELLFFTGHFARDRGDLARAKASWQTLIDRLPPDSPFTAELREAVAALQAMQ